MILSAFCVCPKNLAQFEGWLGFTRQVNASSFGESHEFLRFQPLRLRDFVVQLRNPV